MPTLNINLFSQFSAVDTYAVHRFFFFFFAFKTKTVIFMLKNFSVVGIVFVR